MVLDAGDIAGRLRRNDQRAKIAITLIWVVFSIEIAGFISNIFQYLLLQTIAQGGNVTIEQLEANDTRQQIIAATYFIVYVISWITFIMWFRRAYFNLHTKVNHLSWSESTAAWSWFIPILNLWRPFQIMKELRDETEELLQKELEDYKPKTSASVVGIWWSLWIISLIISQVVFQQGRYADTVDSMMTNSMLTMAASLIDIPLALITIKMVRQYSKAEPLLFKLKHQEVSQEVTIDPAHLDGSINGFNIELSEVRVPNEIQRSLKNDTFTLKHTLKETRRYIKLYGSKEYPFFAAMELDRRKEQLDQSMLDNLTAAAQEHFKVTSINEALAKLKQERPANN